MKMCSCCGRENDAGAIQCREGGTSFVTPAAECPSKESPLPISLRQRIGMWVAAIEATGASVQILALRSSRFPVAASAEGAIQLIGTQDVRAHLRTLVGKRAVSIDGLVCGWQEEAGGWRAELRAAGSAQVFSSPSDEPGTKLREAIASATAKAS